ncbi:MAG: hypothetical protein RR960_08355, partial [Alistipes sp.]
NLENKEFILDFRPKKVHPSINIGKFALRTDVTLRRDMANLTLQEVCFIHFSKPTQYPDKVYKKFIL